MKNEKKIIMLSSIIIGVLVLTFSITYAVFMYQQTGINNHQLVLGDIYMYYEEVNALNLEGAMPGDDYSKYFEFKISGKNTYTKQNIYYDVILSHGDVPDGKDEVNRISDEYLKFKLTKVNGDNSETVIFTDKTYDDLTNKRVYVETIEKNTTEEINNTYRLYMVIGDNLTIGNTSDAMYDSDEFKNMFASIKVNVTGDFTYKEIPTPTFVEVVKGRYGTDETLVAVNTNGDLYNGTGSIREYRYSGPVANNYVFFDTNGNGEKEENEVWRIIGVFEDTVKDEDGNVVNDASGNPTYEEKVKLVRNTLLQDVEMPTSYVIDGTTYTIKSGNYFYWNNKVGGSSKNDWTTAGLQYYLNTELGEDYEASGEIVPASSGYLSLLTTESKEIISPTTYFLGNIDYNVSTVKLSYNQERDETRIHTDNQSSWNGLIGLMYPSDYGYSASNLYWETDMYGWGDAESDGVVASLTSWVQTMPDHSSMGEWLLTPSAGDSFRAMYWAGFGPVYASLVSSNRMDGVRPVLHLKSGTKVIEGLGTEEEPFEVVI